MINLITGASGFIGKKLLLKQLSENKKVAVFVRDKKRLGKLATRPIVIYEGDITNFGFLKKAFTCLNSKSNIETVFHLAANTKYWGDKTELYRNNVEPTINLFNLASKFQVKNFIFTSSIEAMGTVNSNQLPVNELFSPKPISTYGWSKLEAEKQLIRLCKKNKDINLTILRLANVYGPGSLAFVAPVIQAIKTKNKLLKFLPYLQENIFHPVFIDDAIEGISLAENNELLSGEVFIVAGEKFISLKEFFQKIASLINIDFKIPKKNFFAWLQLKTRFLSHKISRRADLIDYFLGIDNRPHRAYSIKKAKKHLSFYPKFNINKGLIKTIEWLKENKLI